MNVDTTHCAEHLLEEQALDWFVRQQRGLSPEESRQWQQWHGAHPAHQQAYARWRAPWHQLEQLPAEGIARLRRNLAADLAADSAQAAARLTPPAAAVRATASFAPRAWLRWLAMPAAAVSLCSAAYLGWWQWMQLPTFEGHYATARGVQQQVTLPDGSQLRLDTLTALDATLYRQRREVRLQEGQAQFNVAHDAGHPFTVLAGPMRITVVGTRFTVRYTPQTTGDHRVQVAVEEGIVRVEPASPAPDAPLASDGAGMLLHAGQQVRALEDGELEPVQAGLGAGTPAWLQYRVTLDNVPLSSALAEFERYGATGLLLGSAEVGDLRLTGSFDARNLGNFLRALPQVLPVRVMPLPIAQAAPSTAEPSSAAASAKAQWRIEAR